MRGKCSDATVVVSFTKQNSIPVIKYLQLGWEKENISARLVSSFIVSSFSFSIYCKLACSFTFRRLDRRARTNNQSTSIKCHLIPPKNKTSLRQWTLSFFSRTFRMGEVVDVRLNDVRLPHMEIFEFFFKGFTFLLPPQRQAPRNESWTTTTRRNEEECRRREEICHNCFSLFLLRRQARIIEILFHLIF